MVVLIDEKIRDNCFRFFVMSRGEPLMYEWEKMSSFKLSAKKQKVEEDFKKLKRSVNKRIC